MDSFLCSAILHKKWTHYCIIIINIIIIIAVVVVIVIIILLLIIIIINIIVVEVVHACICNLWFCSDETVYSSLVALFLMM